MKRARGWGRVVLWAWTAVLTASAPGPAARAADDEELIRQGIEQRRVGQDLKALELFRQAVAIKQTPRGVAQLALAEQALGLWVKAEQDMKAAFALPADGWIKSHRKTLDTALAVIEDHLGNLEIWGEPADAEVRADDQVIGKLPDTGVVRVPVGPLTISVRAAGYTPWSRPFDIKKTEFVKAHVQLVPAAAPVTAISPVVTSAPRAPLALDAPAPQPGGNVVDRPAPAPDTAVRPIYTKWWFWGAVAAVVAGGVITTYALTRNSGTSCAPPGCWQ